MMNLNSLIFQTKKKNFLRLSNIENQVILNTRWLTLVIRLCQVNRQEMEEALAITSEIVWLCVVEGLNWTRMIFSNNIKVNLESLWMGKIVGLLREGPK